MKWYPDNDGNVYMDRLINRDIAIASKITLDGKPARITGKMNRFAFIYEIGDILKGSEWSWNAVRRIINKGGAFRL